MDINSLRAFMPKGLPMVEGQWVISEMEIASHVWKGEG